MYVRLENGCGTECLADVEGPLQSRSMGGLAKHGLRHVLRNVAFAIFLVFAALSLYLAAMQVLDALPPDQRPWYQRQAILASIPVVALFFTWFHIWLAIQMMFRPINFIGIWQAGDTGVGLGWQGVVPRKALKMAKTAYACARPHLMGPRTWLGRCDPVVMAAKTGPEIAELLRDTISEVGPRHFPGVYPKLPPVVLEELTAVATERVVAASPDVWREMVEILCEPGEAGIDNDKMVVQLFTQKKALLNDFFQSVGAKEFKFIEHCGAALGFFCGIVQLVAFEHLGPLGRAIFLPATGFFLGIGTNWLAILVCFWPCFPHEVTLFGRPICIIQGLFLKRQHEASEMYSRLLTDNFFNFNYVVSYLQTQPELWEKLKEVYLRHNRVIFRQALGAVQHVAPMAIGRQQFEALQDEVTRKVVERIGLNDRLHRIIEGYVAVATDIHADNTKSMQAMSPDQFENLLHPVFKEDEWILILLGGVLGAIVGFAQICFL